MNNFCQLGWKIANFHIALNTIPFVHFLIQGIYMDEQVSGVTITNNTIVDIGNYAIYFHCSADNTAFNNILVQAAQQNTDISSKILPGMCNGGGNPTWPDMGNTNGFVFMNNIVFVGDENCTLKSSMYSHQVYKYTYIYV